MTRENIFLEDIEIPEIVQEKADIAFSAIKTEGTCRENMKKENQTTVKKGKLAGGVAAAACAAVVVTAGFFAGMSGHLQNGHREIAGNNSAKDNEIAAVEDGEEQSNLFDMFDKMFTLKVKAAEAQNEDVKEIALEQGRPVPLISGNSTESWVLGGDEDTGVVDYCFNMPLTCEGDNIESVTYSINNGAFQIVQLENKESIVTGGQPYDGELNTGSIGGDVSDLEEDDQPWPYEIVLYKSFTLDYDRQTDESTWINICNSRFLDTETYHLIWGDGKSIQDMNTGLQKMLDNTIITCTINYADSTSESVSIKVDSCLIPNVPVDGEEWKPGASSETTCFTFELQ